MTDLPDPADGRAAADAAACRVLATSRAGAACVALLAAVERAWDRSAARRLLRAGRGRPGDPLDVAARGAAASLAAAATALALREAGGQAEPLTWIVPAGAAVLAIGVLALVRTARREAERRVP